MDESNEERGTMSNKTLIEWNADVGTRFLTIHPDGSFSLNEDTPPMYALGELAKAFIRQQDYIKRLEEFGDDVQHNAILDEDVLTTDEWDKIKESKP